MPESGYLPPGAEDAYDFREVDDTYECAYCPAPVKEKGGVCEACLKDIELYAPLP